MKCLTTIQRTATSAAAVLTLASITATNVTAHEPAVTPAGHAPIGVMGDHIHKAGSAMLSYRYNKMGMKGNLDGTNQVSTGQILSRFMMAPVEMDMEMHMVGAMVGVTEDLTLAAMGSYIRKEMQQVMRNGMRFRASVEGLGDTKIGAIYRLAQPTHHTQLLLNAGLSIPTGSVDERVSTPMNPSAKAGYPMQLGSGSWDPMLGLTLTHHLSEAWSTGAQARSVFRLHDNSEGYRFGNEYGLSGWVAHSATDWLSLSARLDGRVLGDVRGSDSELNPMMMQMANPDLTGGTRVDALLGANIVLPDSWGAASGQRLAIEFGAPIYQHLDGPQMETDYRLTAGWQLAF